MRQLVSAMLFCSMCLMLAACHGGLAGDLQPEAEVRPKPEALAGLLPKPVLPELRVTCSERSVLGVRAGYAWALDGSPKQLDEVWPPPRPSGRLLVSPGEEVTFTVTLPAGSPAFTSARDAVSARISVWDAFAADNRPQIAALYSGDCKPGKARAPGVRFSWRMPEHLACQASGNSFLVRLTVAWGDTTSSPWVSFYWNLAAVEKDVPEAVLSAARRYFDATWAGDELALSKVSPKWHMEEPEGFPRPSPFRAYLPGSREPILWKSPSHVFRLVSPPSILVDNVYSSAFGPNAMCQIKYEVEASDVRTGETERQAVREEVRLEAAGDGSWRVVWASRKPIPAGVGLPTIALRDAELSTVVQVGPFEDVRRLYFGPKWSDDGQWFAFVGSAGGANGIWAASRDGSSLVNLVGLEGTDVQLLDWMPGQHRVRFLTYGYHSFGPHADKTGYWVAEASLDTREVREIAFIRYPRVSFPRDVATTEGRRYLVFRHTPDLWKVDMDTGELTRIAGDVPSWDGLLVLRYSPSKWFAAYPEGFGSTRPGFTVYDLKAGEQRFVSLSDVRAGQAWAHFSAWTPKEELMVLVCPVDEVNHGEDSSHPAGATAIRLYSPAGSLRDEILPPEGDTHDRIGPVAWNTDGSALAIAVGRLSEPIRSHFSGSLEMRHQARAIYVWTRSDGTLRKVADISGTIESLAWVEDGKAIEAWFRVPDDPAVKTQAGVRLGLDGTRLEIQRPIPYRVREGDVLVGSLGDLALIERIAPTGGSTLVVRPRTGDGPETIVNNDVGPLSLYEPVMSPGALAISGEVPDKYGEGVHWVYMVVRRE